MSTFRSIWKGDEKIVISIDCGSTQSGVAYSYVMPNSVPTVSRVLEWPGQSAQKNEAKIPTEIWYDSGDPQSYGAMAVTDATVDDAEENQWELARHFKLHLHPTTMRSKHKIVVEPLPRSVTLEQIYKDFFAYLYAQTKKYFEDHEVNGAVIWQRLEAQSHIDFVIAHPNGWGAHEQAFLRSAAVDGGLVPELEAQQRVNLLSEAEASVHFVMHAGAVGTRLEPGVNFIVCDAGGSTVDTTLYTVTGTSPVLKLEEKRASACVQAGAIYVDQTARDYFKDLFTSADIYKEDILEYTDSAVKSFDKTNFEGPEQPDIRVNVGGAKLTLKSLGITRGKMKVTSTKIEEFFKPWVQQILESVESQIEGYTVKNILLVGGFGDSQYLRRRFRRYPVFNGIEVTLANDSTAKAVADGAVIWYINRSFVTARAARFSYGIIMHKTYDPKNLHHQDRKVKDFTDGKGVDGVWSEIIAKDTVMTTDEEKRRTYYFAYRTAEPNLSQLEIKLYVLTAEKAPYYITDEQGGVEDEYSLACVIRGDMSTMIGALIKSETDSGTFWKLNFAVGISFGATELSARLTWKDSEGIDQHGKAMVIPKKFT